MTELRKLQLIEVETLKEILRICNKYNLKCYLWYGTLLGAVRHGGFIPWDDDLDLTMPEEDYNRFLEIAKSELNDEFFLHYIGTDKNYFPAFARIRRNDTVYIPDVYKWAKFSHNGVWVDIYPLRYAKSNHSLTEKVKFYILRKVFRPATAINVMGVKSDNAAKKLLGKLIQKFDLETLQRWNDRVASSCKKKDAKYLVCEGSKNNMRNYYHPIERFGNGIIYDFEGVPCLIPADWDGVLRQIYGDYMQLPPEEQRVGHLPTIMDLSKVEVPEQE